MSYDQYLLPAASAKDATSAAAFLASHGGPPLPAAADLAARITARDSAAAEHAFLSMSPLGASGDTVSVPAMFSRVSEARDAVFEEAIRAGYGVYDPQLDIVFDPRGAVAGTITSSSSGVFPVIARSAIAPLVERLKSDDYLIVETVDETYIQTRRDGPDEFSLEVRDGSADRHFSTTLSTADAVSSAMLRWLEGGWTVLGDLDWSRLEF